MNLEFPKSLAALALTIASLLALLAPGGPASSQDGQPTRIAPTTPVAQPVSTAPQAPVTQPVENASQAPAPAQPQEERVEVTRDVKPLPGGLNDVAVFNSNSPEVVLADGILLSTFPAKGMALPAAHLNYAFQQRFEIFAHHIADGVKSGHTEDLYLGLLAGNPGKTPVTLKIARAASYLSQPDAPFVSLPQLATNNDGKVFAGPGDRCCLDMLRGKRAPDWPGEVKIAPGSTVLVKSLPIPVRALTPPLNGRSIMASCQSDGPLHIALVSKFAQNGVPKEVDFKNVLTGGALVKPRETPATKPDDTGPIRYGRVGGVTKGSAWVGEIVDRGKDFVYGDRKKSRVSYVISALSKGTFGTDQIQSAPMIVRYDDTAYAGHGNYGVKYELNLSFAGNGSRRSSVSLALENPIKSDRMNPVVFLKPAAPQVFFRGTVKCTFDDRFSTEWSGEKWKVNDNPTSVQYFHYVLHRGEKPEPFLTFDLHPSDLHKSVKVELYYPPDATPPQLLTITTQVLD